MAKHTPVQIENIANTIMPAFIPKDVTANEFSFVFTADGVNYEVTYQRNEDRQWILTSHQQA
jgi:hypothetical protein